MSNAGIPPSSAREQEAAYQPESHATYVKSKLSDQDCTQVLRNLEIAQILKLRGTYTTVKCDQEGSHHRTKTLLRKSMFGIKEVHVWCQGSSHCHHSQMMPNARAPTGASQGLNCTHIAKVSTQVWALSIPYFSIPGYHSNHAHSFIQDGSCILEEYKSLECGLLVNVLACEGKPGKVYNRLINCSINQLISN